jgi:hypothetical protein
MQELYRELYKKAEELRMQVKAYENEYEALQQRKQVVFNTSEGLRKDIVRIERAMQTLKA